MKFIHTADIHASKARKDATLRVLEEIKSTVESDGVRFVIIAGDFWDFTMTATEASGFSDIILAFKSLQDIVPVIMVYGTPSHEPAGSLSCFEVMGNTFVLGQGCHVNPLRFTDCNPLFLVEPEPRLGSIEGNSLDEKYEAIQRRFNDDVSKALDQRGGSDSLILIYHGDVEGAVLQNGQKVPGGGAAMPYKLLKRLNPDYAALGHIHCPQKINGVNAYYPGSPCPKDFGEKHEGSFKIVEI